MAKVQKVGSETVEAYGAEGLPAKFEVVVTCNDNTTVNIGFEIEKIKGQKLYVSKPIEDDDSLTIQCALAYEGVIFCKIKEGDTLGRIVLSHALIHATDKIVFPVEIISDNLSSESPDYCEKVVDFVLGQRVA